MLKSNEHLRKEGNFIRIYHPLGGIRFLVRNPSFCVSLGFSAFPEVEPEIFLAVTEINSLIWVTLSLVIFYT